MNIKFSKRAVNVLETFRWWLVFVSILTCGFIVFWMQLGLWGPAVYDSSSAGNGFLIVLSVMFMYLPLVGISFLCSMLTGLFSSTTLYFFPKARWFLYIPFAFALIGILASITSIQMRP